MARSDSSWDSDASQRSAAGRPGSATGLFIMLVGGWLVIVAATGDYGAAGSADRWSDVVSGSLLIVLGLLRGVWLHNLALLSGFVVLVGVWLVISPFVIGSTGVARWTEVLVGVAAAGLGLAGFMLTPARRPR
jgi:hypothetical protein